LGSVNEKKEVFFNGKHAGTIISGFKPEAAVLAEFCIQSRN
jgi:hypothetical protein